MKINMETIQNIEARALKPSLRAEIHVTTQQLFSDDIFYLNSGSVAAGEEFSVDDLLDLSNENFEDDDDDEDDEEEEEEKDSISVSSQDRVGDDNTNPSAGNVVAFPAVPVDDWKDLEWVSQFVDDSASEISMMYPASYKTGTTQEKRSDEAAEPQSSDCLRRLLEKTPAKARSKRPRVAKLRWRPFGSPSLTDSSSTSSFSSSASTSALTLLPASLHAMEQLVCSLRQQFDFQKPPRKKQKKSRAAASAAAAAASSTGPQTQRRCSHCQVQKTPQWRTGPLGAKTLCNACGVRYKSGRLFPEYRPACSPTFSVEVHSNSHRKVLEMRRKKETCGPDSGLSQMVPSC